MSTNILVIENAPRRADGIKHYLDKLSVKYQIVKIFENDQLPPTNSCSGIIVSGGPMSVYDWEKSEFQFLKKEGDYLIGAIQSDVPILGICLGHQLLTQALGGKVERAKSPEYGWYEVNNLSVDHTLFANIGSNFFVFQYHGDEVSLEPKDVITIAESPACRYQGFKLLNRNVWGIQFHPEITPEAADQILSSRRDFLSEKGIDVNDMVLKGHQLFGQQCYTIFQNFVEVVKSNLNGDLE